MKKISLKTVAMLVVFVCFGLSAATAQEKGEKRKKRPSFSELVKDMDANEDGKLALDEVKGRLKERFAAIDADEDGFITEEEFKNNKPKRGMKGEGKGKRSN